MHMRVAMTFEIYIGIRPRLKFFLATRPSLKLVSQVLSQPNNPKIHLFLYSFFLSFISLSLLSFSSRNKKKVYRDLFSKIKI